MKFVYGLILGLLIGGFGAMYLTDQKWLRGFPPADKDSREVAVIDGVSTITASQLADSTASAPLEVSPGVYAFLGEFGPEGRAAIGQRIEVWKEGKELGLIASAALPVFGANGAKTLMVCATYHCKAGCDYRWIQ